MFRRLVAAGLGLALALGLLVALPSSAATKSQAVAAQTLTWTATDSTSQYSSAPTTAVAGVTTAVFQNTATGMPHTVTFDTSTPGYNHDVSLNLFANPGERVEQEVTLTPGRYRYFCAIPGHILMVGEFTVGPGTPDTTPPTVTAQLSGQREPDGDYIGSATATLTATDTESGVDRIEYSLDGGAFTRYTTPVVVNQVGAHMLHYRATDVAGNTSPERMESFTVVAQPDTTPPTTSAQVAGDREPDGDYVGSATVTVTATDAGSGVASIEYELNDTGFQRYTAPVVVTALGDHSVQYRATDVAGNVAPTKSVLFRVVEPPVEDTIPPTTSAVVTGNQEPDGDYVGSATVTVTATDAGSGVATVEYELDGGGFQPYTAPVTVAALGDHTVRYRATDVAGNVAAIKSVQFRVVESGPVDTTPPTVSAVVSGDRDEDGNYIESALVTLSAEDAESGVDRIEYKLDSGAFVRYTEPVTVSQLGAHMLHYRATDRRGNTSAERMESFTVVEPPVEDTTPPTTSAQVAGDREPDGDYLGRATVTITATDTESGVDRIEYSLDGGAFTRYTAPVVVTSLGAHMLHYRATDIAGNTSPERMESFTVVEPPVEDTIPPTVSAQVSGSRDTNGDYIDSATVTITATDNQSGVDTVEYRLDAGQWTAYTAPVLVGDTGTHTVRYRATDVAGNTSTEGSVTFRVVEPGPDACPNSDTRATVIIGGENSGVTNIDTGNGCTINDLIDEDAEYATHAIFVRYVEQMTEDLVTDGIITRRDKGSIVRAAARSDIGN